VLLSSGFGVVDAVWPAGAQDCVGDVEEAALCNAVAAMPEERLGIFGPCRLFVLTAGYGLRGARRLSRTEIATLTRVGEETVHSLEALGLFQLRERLERRNAT
jgi:hypothetical protein